MDRAPIPQKCPLPPFECYDGSSDPASHLRYYNRVLARWDQDDVVLCRYFPFSLKVSTLVWFDYLLPNSINSYSQLTEKFLRTYMYNKTVNAGMDKLFSLAIGYNETIKEYTDKWHKICQAIGNVDPVVMINFYKWGLDMMSPLFVEIPGSVPTTDGDLQIIIEKHTNLEESQRENPRAQTQRPHRTNSVGQASGSKRSYSMDRSNEERRGRNRTSDVMIGNPKIKFSPNSSQLQSSSERNQGSKNLEWPWSKGKQPPRSENRENTVNTIASMAIKMRNEKISRL
ncbi:uncharacterized protein LOC113278690 [Papaver somniferum]|uniref:uncharacterized protein LOC113278690 n=1 Tax=Papaver somniferum TaxID=3469 RepID=UPI000E6FFC14|nr:uncharacterized protein LOC113278690 [Papaver somniferum]